MTGKRTWYSAEIKPKVALEVLRGELTAAQLAAKHGIHQTMVGEWKRQAMEGLATVFSAKTAASEPSMDAPRNPGAGSFVPPGSSPARNGAMRRQ